MWHLKSNFEINQERKLRRGKYEWVIVIFVTIAIYVVYKHVGSVQNLLWLLENNLRLSIALLIFPFTFYFYYRNYVLHGSLHMRPGKVCLGCQDGMGYSDDGWGFKSYGHRRKNWYQIKACKTPEKCDIHYLYEVKWIPDNVSNGAIKKYKYSIDLKDIGSVFVVILFIIAVGLIPFLFLWILYLLF